MNTCARFTSLEMVCDFGSDQISFSRRSCTSYDANVSICRVVFFDLYTFPARFLTLITIWNIKSVEDISAKLVNNEMVTNIYSPYLLRSDLFLSSFSSHPIPPLVSTIASLSPPLSTRSFWLYFSICFHLSLSTDLVPCRRAGSFRWSSQITHTRT